MRHGEGPEHTRDRVAIIDGHVTDNAQKSTGAFADLARALRSPRTAAVALLSFSSGLPLGLVWFAIPDWMRDIGVDIRLVGLFSLAQAPWAFKVVWSPLMDRYVPPFWGRRRGWMALTQVVLSVLGLLLAGVGRRPEALWIVGAVALATGLASASQDIAYDAYTVEILRPEEHGVAVGARTAFYRAAMAVSGGAAITLAAQVRLAARQCAARAALHPRPVRDMESTRTRNLAGCASHTA